MSSREFAEWALYYQLEPFGEERGDLRSGIVAATVANTARDPKKKAKPYEPKDFMPDFEKATREPDPDAMLKHIEMINAMMGGKDLRKKDGHDRQSGG